MVLSYKLSAKRRVGDGHEHGGKDCFGNVRGIAGHGGCDGRK